MKYAYTTDIFLTTKIRTIRKHRISEREKHDKNATAKRSEQHQRSESSND